MRAGRNVLFATAIVAVLLTHDVALAGDAPRAIDAIENDLVADDPAVRAKAAAELTDRFPDGAVAVLMLVDLLDDESPAVVAAAAKAIDSMAVASATPLAAHVANDANWKPGARLGESLAVLVLLKGPTASDAFDWQREEKKLPVHPGELAAAALLSNRFGGSASAKLVATMRRGGDARPLAAVALAMHGAEELVGREIAAPTHAGRTSAATGAMNLTKSNLDVRAWAGCRILARLRCPDAPVVATLTQTLSAKKTLLAKPGGEGENHSQESACEALGNLGPAAAAAAPVLLDLASKEETSIGVVFASVDALLQMGKEADVVALFGRSPPTADLLAGALASKRRGASAVVPYLIAKFKSSKYGDGLSGLERYGPAAEAALPLFKEHPVSGAYETLQIISAILAVSPTDAVAGKALDTLLNGEDDEDARRALDVLARRGPSGAGLVDRLRAGCARKSRDPIRLDYFCEALGRCGPAAKSALPDLLSAYTEANKACVDLYTAPNAAVHRRDIAVTFGRIGPDAVAAIPALEASRAKGDETIRVAAAQALRRIRAKR